MKKMAKLVISAVIFSLVFSFLCLNVVHAQYNYTQLEKIPGAESSDSDLKSYIESIYQFAIWAVGIAAVLMITIGGFMYLTSAGNTSKMDIAKRVVTDAIIGLVVALSAYLILYVINPDLIKINLSMTQLGTGSGGGSTSAPPGDNKPPADSVGCGKAVDAAKQIMNTGCCYCNTFQDNPHKSSCPAKHSNECNLNACSGSPGFTDCSEFVKTAYSKASCTPPSGNSASMLSSGESISGSSSLKAGDILAVSGHVVMCENDGCSTVIHASGKKDGIKESGGSYYFNNSGVRVLRASKYCGSCGK
jgi:hypothetical protein